MVVFLFLQYNRVLFANVEAYVSPGNIDPANIIVDPNVSVPISKEPKLIIPKINVDVPVVYDTKPDQASQLKAMENGVAWFGIPGASSRPGQVGNTVISGHSSNDLFDGGNFKFIFARLEQLNIGDTFYLNYEGTRYTYSIVRTEVVKPTDVSKLIYETNKPVVTLITCVPVGTSQNRLLVTAEQISPNPTVAKPAPNTQDESGDSEEMPGNSPTFLNRIFGGE
jgi:sortase A